MERKWHVVVDGKQQGPFAELAIQNLLKNGRITEDSYVWCQGMENWAHLKTIPELLSAEPAPPPIQPTPTPAAPEQTDQPQTIEPATQEPEAEYLQPDEVQDAGGKQDAASTILGLAGQAATVIGKGAKEAKQAYDKHSPGVKKKAAEVASKAGKTVAEQTKAAKQKYDERSPEAKEIAAAKAKGGAKILSGSFGSLKKKFSDLPPKKKKIVVAACILLVIGLFIYGGAGGNGPQGTSQFGQTGGAGTYVPNQAPGQPAQQQPNYQQGVGNEGYLEQLEAQQLRKQQYEQSQQQTQDYQPQPAQITGVTDPYVKCILNAMSGSWRKDEFMWASAMKACTHMEEKATDPYIKCSLDKSKFQHFWQWTWAKGMKLCEHMEANATEPYIKCIVNSKKGAYNWFWTDGMRACENK